MSRKRLFVLSVDAMVTEDIEHLKTLPHFSKFYEHCSGCKHVKTVYPSITYPAHVAIQTGCYPEKSGVFFNNTFSTENNKVDWCWDYKYIKCDNIFSAAKRGGYSTCAMSWPVTAYNPDIDHHIAEYWLAHPGETLESTFAEMGANADVMRIMKKNIPYLPDTYHLGGVDNFAIMPMADEFIVRSTCDVIREFKPEVIFIHVSTIDDFRHANGIFNAKVTEGLNIVDEWIGLLVQALKDADVFEDTNFVILSDHGQQDVARRVRPNAYLASKGFIKLNEQGKVEDYTVYGISNGMSMTFYLKDPADKAAHDSVYSALKDMAADGIYGFNKVFTREEAAKDHHMDGNFDFVIDTDGYTSFSDEAVRPWVTDYKFKDYRLGRATHGYLPDQGPQPVFLAKGPDIKPDTWYERIPIVDEAPTFAKILGIDLPDTQGVPLDDMLQK